MTYADVAIAARRAFDLSIAEATQLNGGSFGSVWDVLLSDDRRVVLKCAPDPHVKLLTYEADMVGEEANYLRLAGPAAGAPTAELLYVDDEFVFMSHLPGTALSDLPAGADEQRIREESGAAIAHLHTVTGDFFGYAGARPRAANWPDAFAAIIDATLADAVAWGVVLPVPPEEISAAVAAHRDLLATITTPSLLHFDLWDGNVLAEGGHLSGLVDGERYLWGDPLVDFVSPALFRDMLDDPDHPFARGYAKVNPFTIDHGVRNRLRLYQLYLYLLMIVEYPSRGMDPADDPDRWDTLCTLVRTRVEMLLQPPDRDPRQ